MSKVIQKKIIKDVFEICSKFEQIQSATFVGSFVNSFNVTKNSDIDLIVIIKKINKTFFKNFNKKILNLRIPNNNRKIVINNTFGPLKFNTKTNLVFHIMIYDIQSHIEHVYKSPFTCLDWERSNIYYKNKISNICSVNRLFLKDFNNVRRGIEDYINDINKKKISYREYDFDKLKYRIIKKYVDINHKSQIEYSYHIIKFLSLNFLKFINQKNINFKFYEIDNFYYELMKNEKHILSLKHIYNSKQLKYDVDFKALVKTTLIFINNFEKYLSNLNFKKIILIRHLKTKLNSGYFIGQKTNPPILKNQKLNIKLSKNYIIYSSPLKRCIETFDQINTKKKIIIDNNLKEIDYGIADGQQIDLFLANNTYMIKRWQEKKDPKFPKGENYNDVIKRAFKFLSKVKNNKSNKNTYAITHNVVIRCIIGKILNLPKSYWHLINIKHGYEIELLLIQDKFYLNISREELRELLQKYDENRILYFTKQEIK